MYVVALFYFSDLNVFWCVYNGLRALPLSRIRMGNCKVNLVGLGRFFLFPKALPSSTALLFPCDHTLHVSKIAY